MPARLITTQCHSELNAEILAEILDHRQKKGMIDQEMYENAMCRINESQDGLIIAKAFVRFCVE